MVISSSLNTAKRQNLFKCSRVHVMARHKCALIDEQCLSVSARLTN